MGAKVKHKHKLVGVNSRLDTFQAAILLNKLSNLDYFNKKEEKNCKYLQ